LPNRAGLKQQAIVLICRTRAFALLGGRQLSIASSTGWWQIAVALRLPDCDRPHGSEKLV